MTCYLLRLGRGIIIKDILEAFIEVSWKAISYSCVLQFYYECPGPTKNPFLSAKPQSSANDIEGTENSDLGFFSVLYKQKIKVKSVCSFTQRESSALKKSRFLKQNQFFPWQFSNRLLGLN